MLLQRLLERPALSDLGTLEVRAIQAVRLWVLLRGARQCPTRAVAEKLGSFRAAAHFHLLLEEMAAIWPEPFAVSPLCCRGLSHDEALLAEMLSVGRRAHRPDFDRLLADMVPADERERLFVSAKALSLHLQE